MIIIITSIIKFDVEISSGSMLCLCLNWKNKKQKKNRHLLSWMNPNNQ